MSTDPLQDFRRVDEPLRGRVVQPGLVRDRRIPNVFLPSGDVQVPAAVSQSRFRLQRPVAMFFVAWESRSGSLSVLPVIDPVAVYVARGDGKIAVCTDLDFSRHRYNAALQRTKQWMKP